MAYFDVTMKAYDLDLNLEMHSLERSFTVEKATSSFRNQGLDSPHFDHRISARIAGP